MRKQFAIVALIAALAVPVAVVEGSSDEAACKVQGANGSLEVSAEKMELLRQRDESRGAPRSVTDETGRLVCE